MAYRIERDSMGEFKVPQDALYGAQTARAVANFPVSGEGVGRELIRALGQIKYAAAKVNVDFGHLDPELAGAIMQAAQEVIDGAHDAHFQVDVFQTGSGTSSNMNANEVIANRAIQLLGGVIGSKDPVHPNDHVNYGQSSNDVFPTAIHVAAVTSIEHKLLPAMDQLHAGLLSKAEAFDAIVKIGRTHLQDATPIRLGQEFSGYASQVEHGIRHIKRAMWHLRELAQGGTAVGTGINTHPEFGERIAKALSELTGSDFYEAPNHFEAQAAQDAAVAMSGALKTLASSLLKIANDIRFLGSGPRLGLGELEIPAVQPGSSIMPGKVNPVIAESLIMVCAQVIGNDTTITLGGLYGNFELNVMLPVMARSLLEQITLLANAAVMFDEKLLRDLKANEARIESLNENSLSLATSLAPLIGYDAAAQLAKESYATGKTVRELAFEKQVLPEDQLELALDLRRQTEPGVPGEE
ncbi:MAG: class II fumarate hydratase [Trueperaceae bacterium]|nr:MAG: class II fumarate hydratase [Trueperaceae bacterium]